MLRTKTKQHHGVANRKKTTKKPHHITRRTKITRPQTSDAPPEPQPIVQAAKDQQDTATRHMEYSVPKLRAYIEPPDDDVIKAATLNSVDKEVGAKARAKIVNFFRNASHASDLSKPSVDVPYLLPIGESSPTTYPIPEYLIHTLYHMSNTTLINTGAGMAAPQFGLNYRMFVLRSEFFGLSSPITDIPYAIPYTDATNCLTSPRDIQNIYPKPDRFEKQALAWDDPNPAWDTHSRPNVNVSKSGVDYHDIQQSDDFIKSKNGILYPLTKKLKMPTKDEHQLNLCHDDLLVKTSVDDEGKVKRRLAPALSFINDYRGYSIPLETIEQLIFGPILQAFSQQLSTTTFINPRVVGMRPEYWALREGCFSFPNWAAFVSRPIAIDVEYETLEVSTSQVPRVSKQLAESALLSSALALPPGSVEKQCPKVEDAGLALDHVNPEMTRQLEIKRMIPPPEHIKLVTKKATLRDVMAKSFMHEYDHLDGINFFDRAACTSLSWQPPQKRKAEPEGHYAYPVKLGYAYF